MGFYWSLENLRSCSKGWRECGTEAPQTRGLDMRLEAKRRAYIFIFYFSPHICYFFYFKTSVHRAPQLANAAIAASPSGLTVRGYRVRHVCVDRTVHNPTVRFPPRVPVPQRSPFPASIVPPPSPLPSPPSRDITRSQGGGWVACQDRPARLWLCGAGAELIGYFFLSLPHHRTRLRRGGLELNDKCRQMQGRQTVTDSRRRT